MTPNQLSERRQRLMPVGIPRWVRIYDNGGRTADRYTVVYTGHYRGRELGWCDITGMGATPYHPQGVCLHSQYREIIDRPTYSHLGKRIKFLDLPDDCRRVVIEDYEAIWELNPKTDTEMGDMKIRYDHRPGARGGTLVFHGKADCGKEIVEVARVLECDTSNPGLKIGGFALGFTAVQEIIRQTKVYQRRVAREAKRERR